MLISLAFVYEYKEEKKSKKSLVNFIKEVLCMVTWGYFTQIFLITFIIINCYNNINNNMIILL